MYLYLTQYKKDIIFIIQQALVHDYYIAEILYYFFVYFNDLKCKNLKLQSRRSH
jgi:hypothetical protein